MADYTYNLDGNGIILPDTSTLRQEVEAEYKNIFGDDFDTDSSTPGGILVDAETTSRQSVLRSNVQTANSINPNYAGGIFLDAILALTGDERQPGESDQQARVRRKNSLAKQGRSTSEAIISDVLSVMSVRDVAFLENNTDSNMTINTIEVAAHSTWLNVYIAGEGNMPDPILPLPEIARAYYYAKSAGAGFSTVDETGDDKATKRSVMVLDEFSGQTITVDFNTPATIAASLMITVGNTDGTLNAQEEIKQVIVDYSEGRLDGFDGWKIGENPSVFEIAAAVVSIFPSFFVSACTITTDPADITLQQVATISSENITVINPANT